MARLESITVYPIKSFDGVKVKESTLVSRGALTWDRRLAVVSSDGELLNGKHLAALHRLRAAFDLVNETVTLTPENRSEETFALVGDRSGMEQWLGEVLGTGLVIYENPEGGFPDDPEASGPTIISSATLEEVANWFEITSEEAARRFRANLVVAEVPAFWEDQLYGATEARPFQIGDARFTGVNPCQRCVVPTRDSQTAEVTPRFAKHFQTKREETLPEWVAKARFDHYYRLAVNTLPPDESIGKTVRVGDKVAIV